MTSPPSPCTIKRPLPLPLPSPISLLPRITAFVYLGTLHFNFFQTHPHLVFVVFVYVYQAGYLNIVLIKILKIYVRSGKFYDYYKRYANPLTFCTFDVARLAADLWITAVFLHLSKRIFV
jgi:hypothetical protein